MQVRQASCCRPYITLEHSAVHLAPLATWSNLIRITIGNASTCGSRLYRYLARPGVRDETAAAPSPDEAAKADDGPKRSRVRSCAPLDPFGTCHRDEQLVRLSLPLLE